MKRVLPVVLPLAALALILYGRNPPAPAETHPGGDPAEKKFEDFDKVVKGAKEYDGLFKLYQKDENLYAEIRQDQFDRPLLCPIALAKGGGGMAGFTLNFDEQWVLTFKRSSCAVWRPTAGPTGATSGRCTAASSTRCTSAS